MGGTMKNLQILLLNPPVYDFAAYDFWLRPYGMYRVAGRIGHACDVDCFDFLMAIARDDWGRGRFPEQVVSKPPCFRDIPRRYRRFGRPREEFGEFLQRTRFDAALVQTVMTYWHEGVRETIEDLRRYQPQAKIILGGPYATLCHEHARGLDADLVVRGGELQPLWDTLGVTPSEGLPAWPQIHNRVGVIKITEGCPFRCTYCSVPFLFPEFKIRDLKDSLEEIRVLAAKGARNIAFYDDALLFRPDEGLIPFLNAVLEEKLPVSFHTPNALNARLLNEDLAQLMVKAGFRTFFLGMDSTGSEWLANTGGKVKPGEFSAAVAALKKAGASSITAYVIAGHPDSDAQQIEESVRFAHGCGARVVLSDYAPVPGTLDAERCRPWADPDEPLSHNKTAFAIRRLGFETLNRLNNLCTELNQ
jgi:radical SAM superfamily enzyme YgiQ (UPF0313 family)